MAEEEVTTPVEETPVVNEDDANPGENVETGPAANLRDVSKKKQ